MAKIYLNRVLAGTWNIEDVPDRWRADVERMLEEEAHG